jgi:hypothetical protein
MIRNLAVVLVVLSLAASVSAQGDKKDYVAIPSESVLLTVASPPGCPLQFENARLLMNVNDGSYVFAYNIRNVSTKPVARWEPMFWTSQGTGGTLIDESDSQQNRVLLPDEVLRETPPQLTPLTDDLRKRLHLDQRGMVVLVIKEVVFQDGSRYENRSLVKSIISYFEQLSTDLNRLENLTGKQVKGKPR